MRRKKSRAAEVAEKAQTTARETVLPAAESAVEKIGTAAEALLVQVADKVAPALDDAREQIRPVAKEAVRRGREKGQRAAVKMGLIEPPKKSHKLRKLMTTLGLAGAAAWAYSRWTGKDSKDSWTPAPARGRFDEKPDVAPTAPLASEETVESPVPTTPDKPLEKKDIP